jgi:hypothetical protein
MSSPCQTFGGLGAAAEAIWKKLLYRCFNSVGGLKESVDLIGKLRSVLFVLGRVNNTVLPFDSIHSHLYKPTIIFHIAGRSKRRDLASS